ncbi:hypothetical protein EDD22DRAFT_767439 [Suillus occidentalis]|nr:hypothetical protein EDD22DRAFT_767439 [Suillus occidentalis]
MYKCRTFADTQFIALYYVKQLNTRSHGLGRCWNLHDDFTEPPYYLLVSHSSLQHSSGLSSNSLAHASVEYRYADDSPLMLLSRHPDEHVLVLNHDPAKGNIPTVQSTSSHMAVTGIKVSVAPGASVNEDHSTNDNMYVLEVASTSDDQ